MKKLIFFSIVISLVYIILFSTNSNAIMEDYCASSTYVVQNLSPNVMIVLDNSGSMFNFAYADPGADAIIDTADDNRCTASGTPCENFTARGTYPGVTAQATDDYKYYGYFNPDYWYTYATGRFTPTAPKTGSGITGARAKAAAEWDGNFLNWLTMRRIDIIRKVLTGGSDTGTGTNARLLAENADCAGRGRYKRIANADLYTPYSGTRKFYVNTAGGSCDGSGSGTSSFDLRNDNGGGDGTGNETAQPFGVDIVVATAGGTYVVPVDNNNNIVGVVQEIADRTRVGLAFYRPNTSASTEGGYIQRVIRDPETNCGGSNNWLTCVVNEINGKRPDSNTPLAETLWAVTGYFAQDNTIEDTPGPNYNNNAYTINANNDPYNYGTGGQATWPSCAKSYVLYITDGEPCADGYLPSTIADYASGKSSYNCSGGSCSAVAPFSASTFPTCGAGNYVAGIEDVALYAHTTDLRSATIGVNAIADTQNLTMYFVFAFGQGSTLLKYAAINGGFKDSNNNNVPDLQSEWDNNSDNMPDNYYEATEGSALEGAIKNAFSNMLERVSSGTGVSVLASGEGSGANLAQAIFHPRRRFGNNVISWTGELQNFWYHIDPFLANSSIREDTIKDSILDLSEDYIIQFYYDPVLKDTMLRRRVDSDGDGDIDSSLSSLNFASANSLWKVGRLLWERDITASGIPRKIYTSLDGTTLLPIIDTTTGNPTNVATLRPYMDLATDAEASNIIKYVHGEDITQDTTPADGINDYRSRTVTIGANTRVWKLGDIVNSTPTVASFVPVNTYHCPTPKYNDTTYGGSGDLPCYQTGSSGIGYINTTTYKNRNMVFVGANDGMLHAFKLGKLEYNGAWKTENDEKAKLADSNLGEERWAFIPKNALPYLKYIANPEYCHIYTVDLTPYLVDASVGGGPNDSKICEDANGDGTITTAECPSWRTILIGGMRFGGACAGTNVTTATRPDTDNDGLKDFVNTPVNVSGVGDVGFSSYFAIDVTDPENPDLLWEFSRQEGDLGFATTGPAVVRVGGNNTVNGKWFVVFGSGPTGPINSVDRQFMGRSDQNLKFFVFDLKNGPGAGNINVTTIDSGIQYAFASSIVDSTIDPDVNYSDDAFYVGYVTRAATTNRPPNPPTPATYKWTEGGIGKIVTYENTDPTTWKWRKIMDGIGPVSSAVGRLQNPGLTDSTRRGLWLLFGTGRQYYVTESERDDPPSTNKSGSDDPTSQRRLFSVKEPCFIDDGQYGDLNPNCTTNVAIGDLTNVTNISNVPSDFTAYSSSFKGWYINLDSNANYTYRECQAYNNSGNCTSLPNVTKSYLSERVITPPNVSPSECVFFTSYKPYNDICGIGGKSFIWATKFNTGGACTLKGKALMQVSTGAIEEIDLKDAFTNRKSEPLEGVPCTDCDGPTVVPPPPPVKKLLHIRER